MEEHFSVSPRCEHCELLTKLLGIASITLDVERNRSTSLVQHLPRIWECPCRRCGNRLKLKYRLPRKLPRIMTEDRTACIRVASLGTKASGKTGSGKKFYNKVISGADFAAQPTMLQLSLQSSITAWAAWKLMSIQQSWPLTERQSGVCTQLVRSREACTATIDWEATLSWIALFSAVCQELLVQCTCWVRGRI